MTKHATTLPDCRGGVLLERRRAVRLFLLCLLACILFGAGCAKHPPTPTGPVEATPDNVVKVAKSQLGARYRSGGCAPDQGYDCSGLVRWVYGQCGVTMPRTSGEQMKMGRSITKAQLQPGDLVGFYIRKRATHTGIYIGGDKFIHSPNVGDSVREDSLNSAYWKGKLTATRRILAAR